MVTTIEKIQALHPIKYPEGGTFNVGIWFDAFLDPQPVLGTYEFLVEIQNGFDNKNIPGDSGKNSVSIVLVAKKDAQEIQEIPLRVRVFFTSVPFGAKTLLAERKSSILVTKECPHGKVEILETCPDGTFLKIRTCSFGEWIEESFVCDVPPEEKKIITTNKGAILAGGLAFFLLLLLLGRRRT